MSKNEKVIDAKSETPPQAIPSQEDAQLVCKWWDRKQEADNGLNLSQVDGAKAIGHIQFLLKGRSPKEEGDYNLLHAKIYEIFGVYNPGVAVTAIEDCLNCMVLDTGLMDWELEKAKVMIDRCCENILSLFQEMRPKDSFELMIVTKLIILNYLSNREFISACSSCYEENRTIRQTRGIKLSRLFLEFKDKLDKHRKPDQQIHVQHNHIHNEGQAIIGSQLSMCGGR